MGTGKQHESAIFCELECEEDEKAVTEESLVLEESFAIKKLLQVTWNGGIGSNQFCQKIL